MARLATQSGRWLQFVTKYLLLDLAYISSQVLCPMKTWRRSSGRPRQPPMSASPSAPERQARPETIGVTTSAAARGAAAGSAAASARSATVDRRRRAAGTAPVMVRILPSPAFGGGTLLAGRS